MTKSDLMLIVSQKVDAPQNLVENTINTFLFEIKKALKKGDKVVVSGLGTFYITKVNDKRVVPFGKAGSAKIVKGHRVVNFRVGRPLRRAIW